MSAYAAVNSLMHTIDGLLESSHISLVSSTRLIFKLAYYETKYLRQVLEKFNDSSRSSERLDGQIRDAAHKLEDFLALYELQSYQDMDEGALSLDHVEGLRQEINSFVKVEEMMVRYNEELLISPVPEDDDDDDAAAASVSPNSDVGVEMVGHYSEFTQVRDHLLKRMRPDDMCFLSYVGEVGTGTSIIAKSIFDKASTSGRVKQ